MEVTQLSICYLKKDHFLYNLVSMEEERGLLSTDWEGNGYSFNIYSFGRTVDVYLMMALTRVLLNIVYIGDDEPHHLRNQADHLQHKFSILSTPMPAPN